MRPIDSCVKDFMQAPVAAAMFVLADRHGLDAGQLAAPAIATVLASTALRDLNPWGREGSDEPGAALELVQPGQKPSPGSEQ